MATSKRRSRARPVAADTSDSTCFDQLVWFQGEAFFTFRRDDYQDSVPMSRAEFNQWKNSDSLGGTYNALYRR